MFQDSPEASLEVRARSMHPSRKMSRDHKWYKLFVVRFLVVLFIG